VRDILVSKPDPRRQQTVLELAQAHYDAVLVHADADLFPFAHSFPPAAGLGDRLHYTGFVLDRPSPVDQGSVPAVLVSAGGGAVGEGLLRLGLEARAMSRLRDRRWLVVAGSQLPSARLEALKAADTEIVLHRPDLAFLFGRADVSVSQAGYNAVVEGLAGRARMILVPYAVGGEDEQTRRAIRLAELDLATHLPEAGLNARKLAAAIDTIVHRPRPATASIAFDGGSRTAEIISQLLHRHAA
jgi:predicted glycosyltransferase